MRIAIAQIEILMGDKRGNVDRTIAAIEVAGKSACEVCLLPECSLSGWLSPKSRAHAETADGPTTTIWRNLARFYSMNIIGGFEERFDEHIYNSAVVINRAGKLVSVHRKINELDFAQKVYSNGQELRSTEIDQTTIGVNICADNWTPHNAAVLFSMGARILFSPCAWAVEPGKEKQNLSWIKQRYRAVARLAPLWIVTANSVGKVTSGPWKGRIFQGNSLVIDPTRKTFFRAGSEPKLCVVDIPEALLVKRK